MFRRQMSPVVLRFHPALFQPIVAATALVFVTALRPHDRLLAAPQPHRLAAGPDTSLVDIEPNDNRHPAGVISGTTRRVALEARLGVWHPDGRDGAGVTVAAFSEPGAPPQTPGPLLRVQLGTRVEVSVTNRLAVPMTMHGFGAERGVTGDSLRLAPGESRTFAFRAATVGTFYYAATTGKAPVIARHLDDSQLHGAIVVDSGATPDTRNDRVFVLSWWYEATRLSRTGLTRATMTINGRAWPHTERIDVAQGDSLRWRWINMTLIHHPMHLHGFYFRVDGDGDGTHFTSYARDNRRQAVTENLRPGHSMELVWSPTRPGNWLFHCHMASHMSPLMNLSTVHHTADASHASAATSPPHDAMQPASADVSPPHDAMQHAMGGLVLGIRVSPRGEQADLPRQERPIRLLVESRDRVFGNRPGYRYTVSPHYNVRSRGAFGGPGETLVLQQHEPVAVTIVNRTDAPTAVHWHGIELESLPDGVPGWSGNGNQTLAAIAAHDSVTVHFTPPRAGTFMYHSHYNELDQIASGLFGAIVVLPRGTRWQPDRDRTLIFSDDGPTDNLIYGPYPAPRLNGQVAPAPLTFRRGLTYRLRLINIRTDYTMRVWLRSADSVVARWTPLAKDGAELPAAQSVEQPSTVEFAPGEIYDLAFTPRESGRYVLEYRRAEQSPLANPTGRMEIVVR